MSLITVNKYFDHVYLLNLDRRQDRLEKSSNKLKNLNIEFERFSAVDGLNLNKTYKIHHKIYGKPECVMGCLLSHYYIIKDAKEKNYKRILIFEDDIMIINNFNAHFQKVKQLNDWKLLYLGASQFNWDNLEHKNDYYFSKESLGTFSYGIDSSIYDEILNCCEKYIKNDILMAVDKILVDDIQKKYYKKCFTLFPNIIICNVLDSDIRNVSFDLNYKKRVKWESSDEYY